MKTTLIIIGLIVLLAIIKACVPSEKSNKTTNSNDKLIFVQGASYEDLKKVITAYCNMYDFVTFPNLKKISDREFAITFSQNINFEHFCYFINYVKYPNEVKYNIKITAWTTTTQNDIWITNKSVNKKVMLFISEDDTEYDNVFMTTEDNIGYKLGFADGEEKQLLSTPVKKYEEPSINSLK